MNTTVLHTLKDWEKALIKEWEKLDAVCLYLNADGHRKMRSIGVMLNYTPFVDSARDLLDWFRSGLGMEEEEQKLIFDITTYNMICCLERIAKEEGEE